MPLRLELRCAGPEGPSNGCPEEHPALLAESHDGQDQLRAAFSGLARRVEALGWARGRDNAYRCPQCLAASARPREIAGIPYAKWEEALDRFCAGEPASVWGGQDGLPTPRQFNNVIHSGRYPELRARWMAGPTYKADRKVRSESLADARWALVLARFLAGEDKAAICTDEAGLWPSVTMWNGRMERDAAFRDAVNGEHERRRLARAAEIDWEAALSAFADGETLAEMEAAGPAMPRRNEWAKRVATDEAFRARVIAARPTSSGAARLLMGSGKFARVQELMALGLSLVDAVARVREEPAAPAPVRQRRDYLFRVRDVAARLKLTEDAARQRLHRYQIPRQPGGVYGWDDAAAFERVIDTLCSGAPPKSKAAARAKAQAADHGHAKALAANPLYAAIEAAVPRGLPHDVRADVISQMALDVLEGWLDLADVKKAARQYLTAHDRASGRWDHVSLDAPMPGTDDLRMIDTLTTDTVRF